MGFARTFLLWLIFGVRVQNSIQASRVKSGNLACHKYEPHQSSVQLGLILLNDTRTQ